MMMWKRLTRATTSNVHGSIMAMEMVARIIRMTDSEDHGYRVFGK